ncbi:MAG: helix-turn-helix domain-containing protein [Methyloceanibacter sp.]|jgi:transcriptional regulator GlxA family with amidase domain|uniref:GlxA family transcriptional regulator n=1 Tax=Methyloceanibacter sp. TaxID=1965321 RepID=UPI003C3135CC
MNRENEPLEALIVAVPETAGSALYGMVDVLTSAGNLWQQLTGGEQRHPIRPRIVSLTRSPFSCGNRVPVEPELELDDDPSADIVILPELWLAPDDDFKDRYPELLDWIRRRYRAGSTIYSACSGSIMLAATGLLDAKEATSHWGYQDLFRTHYPKVKFRPEPNLCFADAAGRIVTAGGTTSWHDLAIHIIARHCSPGEAMRIAKVYLLKWHGEGQLPYASLIREQSHADSVVRKCEDWLAEHYRDGDAVVNVAAFAGIPERSLKRRFKIATGTTLIGHVQNLRVEEAKRRLETERISFEQIAADLGYENHAFFRRLFKRSTGLTPGAYRRMFLPFIEPDRASDLAGKSLPLPADA